MPSVGDIVKITSCKKLFTEDVCNVFYYAVGVWTGNLTIEDFLADLQSEEVNVFSPFTVADLTWETMRWDNLTSPAEIAEYINPSPDPGLRTDGEMPSFVAMGVQLTRTNLTTRHGQKRFGGVTEALTTGQAVNIGASDVTNVENFCGTTFTSLQGDELDPVIVGRTPAGLPDLARVNPVLNAILKTNLTTQNTRKAGRGS